MLNKGKVINYDESTGFPVSVSYGNQSPSADAVPLKWREGDRRYPAGVMADQTIIGWYCTASGTPGTWSTLRGVGAGSIDLFLSYGMSSVINSGTLPSPPEASPAFYLRPDTDLSVPQSFSFSPNSICEWTVGVDVPANKVSLNLYIQQCGLSGSGPVGLYIQGTKNGLVGLTEQTPNLDGYSQATLRFPPGGPALTADDKIGLLVTTTGLGSGFLVMTAHLSVNLN